MLNRTNALKMKTDYPRLKDVAKMDNQKIAVPQQLFIATLHLLEKNKEAKQLNNEQELVVLSCLYKEQTSILLFITTVLLYTCIK